MVRLNAIPRQDFDDPDLFHYLYKEGAVRGEIISMRFRWLLMLTVLLLIISMFLRGLRQPALMSLLSILIFAGYNFFLLYLVRRNRIEYWVRYLSVTLDICVLTFHIYNYSRFFSEIAVATAASILIYPILMFLSVLRYDKKLIIYATLLTVMCFNIIYFLRYPYIDKSLIARVVSSDPSGHLYKSVYFLLFGFLLLHIPKLVENMVSRQKQILEEKSELDLKLALETHENKFIGQRLAMEQQLNQELSLKNEQIREQNKQLHLINDTKARLLSIIGNDLRNPFTILHSISHSLLDHYQELSQGQIHESLQVIADASGYGVDLLENLLNWSRAQAGKIIPEPMMINIYEIAVDTTLLMNHSAISKDIRINNRINSECLVYSDPQMTRTIFRNLLANAIKYSYPSSEVSLISEQFGGHIRISVRDSGTGITRENQDKLFSISEQVSTSGTLNEKGTGLGLLICKEFVEINRGSIGVLSEPGSGSLFWFSLPSRPA